MKKIAIIGASYLQLPLVLKANEMGLETHCFAWDKDAICKFHAHFFYPISILEKEQILEKCKEIGVDGILTIASDIATLTVNYVAEKLNLIGNGYESAQLATNKHKMRTTFAENNLKSPRYRLIKKGQVLDNSKLIYPLIVKPTDRSGSLGVIKVNEESQLNEAIKQAQTESFAQEAIVEQFIEGKEVSVESISWEGKHYILAITDKEITKPPYFVELAHHQPSLLKKDVQIKIKEETIKALNAVNLKYGAGHTEFLITKDDEIFIVEVGARMGGDFIGSDLVYLSTGYDFLKAVVNIAMGSFETPKLVWEKYSGIYFLSKETDYLLKYFEEETIPEIIKKELLSNELKSIHSSSERSGYIIYQSDKREQYD